MRTLFTLKLYTTSHCHLCEQAKALILQQQNIKQVQLIEITEDEALLLRYEVRIPVLQRSDTLAELDWPFDADTLNRFISA